MEMMTASVLVVSDQKATGRGYIPGVPFVYYNDIYAGATSAPLV